MKLKECLSGGLTDKSLQEIQDTILHHPSCYGDATDVVKALLKTIRAKQAVISDLRNNRLGTE